MLVNHVRESCPLGKQLRDERMPKAIVLPMFKSGCFLDLSAKEFQPLFARLTLRVRPARFVDRVFDHSRGMAHSAK